MGLKLHNPRRSYELRDLFLRLQDNREVNFLSSGVHDGDMHGLTEIIGFVEPSEEDIKFCRDVVSMLKEVGSELQVAEKRRDIVQVMTITFVLCYDRHKK